MGKKFTRDEIVFIILIGLALGFRQVAMNLVTPFVATYTSSLVDGSLFLAGVALGIFGLTQGLFQVPFGIWSDKYGYKKMILIGVFIMMIGMGIAVFADNAYLFVLSRAVQGIGAITSAGYAWLSGSLRAEKRADAISIVGIIVGICSAVGFGGSPILREFMPVENILILALIAITIMFLLIAIFLKDIRKEEDKKIETPKLSESFKYMKRLIKNKSYLAIITVAFINGFVGISGMFVIPEYCKTLVGTKNMWMIFTPAILISIIIMRLSMKFVKKGYGKRVAEFGAVCLFLGIFIISLSKNPWMLEIGSLLLLTGYNTMFSLIPTIVNFLANNRFRGIANGTYNLMFYIGDFIGTTIVGALWSSHAKTALTMLIIFSFLGILFTIFVIPSFNHLKQVD
ncbi:MAG: MFS transporter [Sarcina sp.]